MVLVSSIIHNLKALFRVFIRECRRYISDPIYFFGLLFAPLFAFILFPTMMIIGSPSGYPVGIVAEDNSASARLLARTIDSMQEVEVVAHYSNIADANRDMRKGKIYGFYLIPSGMAEKANLQKQPKVSFYYNGSVLLASTMVMKNFKMASELTSASALRQVLTAKGLSDSQLMPILQPIVIDARPLNNPWLNYSIYLNNCLLMGMVGMMILLMTTYAIGVEIKQRQAVEWIRLGDNSIWLSLIGKLLPQFFIFLLLGLLYIGYIYGILHFPLNSGFYPMLLAIICFILACQSLGVVIIGIFPTLRFGMSIATLWSVMSFSISGFTFPSMAMHPSLQALANLFPLRHYYLIYCNQALNGYSMTYSWISYLCLLLFMVVPFLIGRRLKSALLNYKYVP